MDKVFLVYVVGGGEGLGDGVEARGPSRDNSSDAVAVIRDFFRLVIIDRLQQVLLAFLPSMFLSINIDFSIFDDINPFLALRLVQKVVGGEKNILEFI
jgi:hypothetical protein